MIKDLIREQFNQIFKLFDLRGPKIYYTLSKNTILFKL